jgi:glycosyltransferase involved in cell wall biosynthesis
MAEKVLYLLRNSENAFAVAKAGRKSAEKFSWRGITSQLRSLYFGAYGA